jgi:hypothetical protein
MSLLARPAAIRARNLAKYSPESQAMAERADESYNWRWRGWLIVALVLAAVAQLTPTPVRIAGDILCLAALAASFGYFYKHLKEVKKAVAALRASRRAYERQQSGPAQRPPGDT